jgi:hypothetical protein
MAEHSGVPLQNLISVMRHFLRLRKDSTALEVNGGSRGEMGAKGQNGRLGRAGVTDQTMICAVLRRVMWRYQAAVYGRH